MTRGQRRAHRIAWLALVPLLAAVIVLAWMRREQTRAVFYGGGGAPTEAPR